MVYSTEAAAIAPEECGALEPAQFDRCLELNGDEAKRTCENIADRMKNCPDADVDQEYVQKAALCLEKCSELKEDEEDKTKNSEGYTAGGGDIQTKSDGRIRNIIGEMLTTVVELMQRFGGVYEKEGKSLRREYAYSGGTKNWDPTRKSLLTAGIGTLKIVNPVYITYLEMIPGLLTWLQKGIGVRLPERFRDISIKRDLPILGEACEWVERNTRIPMTAMVVLYSATLLVNDTLRSDPDCSKSIIVDFATSSADCHKENQTLIRTCNVIYTVLVAVLAIVCAYGIYRLANEGLGVITGRIATDLLARYIFGMYAAVMKAEYWISIISVVTTTAKAVAEVLLGTKEGEYARTLGYVKLLSRLAAKSILAIVLPTATIVIGDYLLMFLETLLFGAFMFWSPDMGGEDLSEETLVQGAFAGPAVVATNKMLSRFTSAARSYTLPDKVARLLGVDKSGASEEEFLQNIRKDPSSQKTLYKSSIERTVDFFRSISGLRIHESRISLEVARGKSETAMGELFSLQRALHPASPFNPTGIVLSDSAARGFFVLLPRVLHYRESAVCSIAGSVIILMRLTGARGSRCYPIKRARDVARVAAASGVSKEKKIKQDRGIKRYVRMK